MTRIAGMTDEQMAVRMKFLVDSAPESDACVSEWLDWRRNGISDEDADLLWATAIVADRTFCGGGGEKMLTDLGYQYGRAKVAVCFMRAIEERALENLFRMAPGGAA